MALDNLIYLLLFTYPGALVQILFNEFVPQYIRYEKENSTLAVARYFFYSVCVSFMSIFAFVHIAGIPTQGFQAFVVEMQKEWRIAQYFGVSILGSGAFAFLWHWFRKAVHKLHKKARDTGRRTVWEDIIRNPDVFVLGKAVAVIRKGDKTWAGLPEYVPTHTENDMGICLTRREFVEDILKHEPDRAKAEKYIGHDIATYVDLERGFDITFYAAPKVYAYLGLGGGGGGGGGEDGSVEGTGK